MQVRENYSDESDKATAVEMMELEQSRARMAKAARRDQEPGPDGLYPTMECIACGGEIGIERIKVALRNTMCVYCAADLEKRK